jgi:hypothetical protein
MHLKRVIIAGCYGSSGSYGFFITLNIYLKSNGVMKNETQADGTSKSFFCFLAWSVIYRRLTVTSQPSQLI